MCDREHQKSHVNDIACKCDGQFIGIAVIMLVILTLFSPDVTATESIIVPAHQFYEKASDGNRLVRTNRMGGKTVFKSEVLNLKRTESVKIQVEVSEAGRYDLFVRSHGNRNRSFGVTINGKRDSQTYGQKDMRWTRGDTYQLPVGKVNISLTGIVSNPYLDTLVLTRDPGLPERFLPEPPADPKTIIVDASDTLQGIVRDTPIVGTRNKPGGSVYRNFALDLLQQAPIDFDVSIPETGRYHLYVRSHGNEKRGFQVEVNGKTASRTFGRQRMDWKWGGMFRLASGMVEVRLKNIDPHPYFDAIVLTQKSSFPAEILRRREFPDDRELLAEHPVPRGTVKFGDLNGNGRTGFVVITSDYSLHAFNDEGEKLWQYETPPGPKNLRELMQREAPGSLWDFNRDGKAEVVHWRWQNGREKLVMADGETGTALHSTAWPGTNWPHEFWTLRTAVAQLSSGRPNELVVLTNNTKRPGGGTITVTAYNHKLQPLWQHKKTDLKKNHYGHYPYPFDLTGDDLDEVVAGHVVLKPSGDLIWDHTSDHQHHDHPDSMRFPDLNGDQQPEIVAAHSDRGVVAMEALSGKYRWEHGSKHGQQVSVGNFLDGYQAPQIAITARSYGTRSGPLPYLWNELYFFDPDGNLIARWPGDPIPGNTDSVVGDWTGTGSDTLFWHRFRINRNGSGELYFSNKVYHMFDYTGNGAAEVITRGPRPDVKGSVLRIWGSKNARDGSAKRDAQYVQDVISNHTHY